MSPASVSGLLWLTVGTALALSGLALVLTWLARRPPDGGGFVQVDLAVRPVEDGRRGAAIDQIAFNARLKDLESRSAPGAGT